MANINEKINAEFENIETVLYEIAIISKKTDLSMYEINSLALYLNNFYNGIENILKQLLKNYNIPLPKSENWHKDLLQIAENEKFISAKTRKSLREYVGFRHFIIHNYAFKIEIELLFPLINRLEKTYSLFKKEILKHI